MQRVRQTFTKAAEMNFFLSEIELEVGETLAPLIDVEALSVSMKAQMSIVRLRKNISDRAELEYTYTPINR